MTKIGEHVGGGVIQCARCERKFLTAWFLTHYREEHDSQAFR